MLPGKAIRLPRPSRLRSKLAQNAMPTPHAGPSVTAARMLTICCTGAHLLPATGTLIKLPTIASAVRTPASASFFVVLFCFIVEFSFLLNKKGTPHLSGVPAVRNHGTRCQRVLICHVKK